MTVPNVPEELRPSTRTDEPLWSMTSMRVGGPARWVMRPASTELLQRAIAWAVSHELAWIALGAGTNVIFPDKGFAGLVLATHGVRGTHLSDTHVIASCGTPLAQLAQEMNHHGLSGLEWAVGIPGTIGGSVVTNAGAHGADMASVLECITLLREDAMLDVRADELRLGYRTSAFRSSEETGVILSAGFRLVQDDPHQCQQRAEAFQLQRRRAQPVGASAGCIFRNPEGTVTAGELLDRAGCKGLRVGAAVVSSRHANFIINEGRENAADILQLIDRMHDRVLATFSIDLIPEVDIMGT